MGVAVAGDDLGELAEPRGEMASELILESLLLGVSVPPRPLPQIDAPVRAAQDRDHSPAHRPVDEAADEEKTDTSVGDVGGGGEDETLHQDVLVLLHPPGRERRTRVSRAADAAREEWLRRRHFVGSHGGATELNEATDELGQTETEAELQVLENSSNPPCLVFFTFYRVVGI